MHMLIPALRRRRQEDQKLKVIFSNIVNSKPSLPRLSETFCNANKNKQIAKKIERQWLLQPLSLQSTSSEQGHSELVGSCCLFLPEHYLGYGVRCNLKVGHSLTDEA